MIMRSAQKGQIIHLSLFVIEGAAYLLLISVIRSPDHTISPVTRSATSDGLSSVRPLTSRACAYRILV